MGMGGVGRAGEDMARQQKERVAGEGEMRGRYGAGGVARGVALAVDMALAGGAARWRSGRPVAGGSGNVGKMR